MKKLTKKDVLKETIKHIDIKKIDSTAIIDSMRGMSFVSRETASATDIFMRMLKDKKCSIILTIAGSNQRCRMYAGVC
jgi:deoxyhypusine synthase